jgi:transglutaminase-like putative cysteine protease
MQLERFLQLGMVTLAALGAVLLGMGQRAMPLTILAVVAAATSYYVTDLHGWLRLGKGSANLLAAAAAVITLSDFYFSDSESMLLSIAYLLISLQVVVLFQEKTERVYWQLAMSSLLQVVVACVLNEGLLFGVLLIGYLFVGLLTLAVFFIHRETRLGRGHSQAATPAPPPATATGARWPLAHQRPSFAGAVSGDLAQSALGRGLFRQMGLVLLGSLVFSFCLFYALPRLKRGATGSALAASPQRVVGFSPHVRLGALGSAVQNPELVMQVRFYDGQTRQPYPLVEEPMFRGSLLVSYQGGQWEQSRRRAFSPGNLGPPRQELPLAGDAVGRVRQRIALEPLNEAVVFCIYPAERMSNEDDLDFVTGTQQIERGEQQRERKWEVELSTTGLWKNRQWPVTPHAPVLTEPALEHWRQEHPASAVYGTLSEEDRGLLTAIPADLRELPRLAAERLAAVSLPATDRIGRSMLLEQYLRDSGEFVYSLRGVARDPGDPVEDFLFRHKQGHCEYFASALTLLLRSQGIPARIVVGFKGGDFNSYDNVYSVRQLHAHTWVEAYLEPEQLPPWPLGHPASNYAGGGWLRLDPTPGVDESGVSRGARRWFAGTRELAEYLQRLWSNYVVGLTPERQQTAIYGPLLRSRETLVRLLQRETWSEWTKRINWQSIRSRNWFSWRGGLAGMAISLALVGLYVLLRALLGRWWRWLARRRDAARPANEAAIEFYRRFEQLAARRGLNRRAPQTAHEFAEEVAGHLAANQRGHQIAELPPRLADRFYQVRFGGRPLDDQQFEQVEQALASLQGAFEDSSPGGPGHSP